MRAAVLAVLDVAVAVIVVVGLIGFALELMHPVDRAEHEDE